MQSLVNVLIIISQFANVVISSFTKERSDNDADEMLCAKCWRLRYKPFWSTLRVFFDEYSPLSEWKGKYDTHCQACYEQEKIRLQERIKQYEDWSD